jgi:DNA-binding response OmpR family regulator
VGTETILLVEDESSVRELVANILKDHGYHVLEAQDGVDGVQVSGEYGGPIHLLLTDVVMPKMNGKKLAERLRSQRPELRVLYLSGYTDPAILRGGVLEPSMNFVPKPVSEGCLTHMVRAVLDGAGRAAA